MIQAFVPFLALRYLLTRRINLLSTFGVLFAVWATLLVDGVFTGFVFEIRNDVRRATPDLLVTDLPHRTDYDPIHAAIIADQGLAPDIAAIAPRLRHYALLQPLRTPPPRPAGASEVNFDQMEGGFALVLGVDPLLENQVTDLEAWRERGMQSLLARGHNPQPSQVLAEPDDVRRSSWLLPDDEEWRARGRADVPRPATAAEHRSTWPGVFLGWRRARHAGRMLLGDPIELLTAIDNGSQDDPAQAGSRVAPRHTRLAFAGYFATGYRLFDETSALMPIETLRTVMGHDMADPDGIALITDVAVRLRPDLPRSAWRGCQERLEAAVNAVLPPGSAPCRVLDWEQQNEMFLTAVANEHKMMQSVLFIVMLVAAFVIYATLHMMVVQKWKDVGILAAVGGNPSNIGSVFLLCGLVVGSVGAVLGTGLGLLSVAYLNDVNDWFYRTTSLELFPRSMFDLQRVPCHLEPSWVVTVALGAIAMALIVSYLPARRAARMNPVQALSYE